MAAGKGGSGRIDEQDFIRARRQGKAGSDADSGAGPGKGLWWCSMSFDHEKLDVYQLALEFLGRADEVARQLPRGRGYLAEQLQRASLSILLNIAEGAGKFSGPDKALFYTRARGSVTECAAVLDGCRKLRLIGETVKVENKEMLERIASMLTKLIKSHRPT